MAESEFENEELPLESPGSRLRRAREAAGLSLGDVAARTKIAERHLASIEASRFGDLASRTYAVGFARAYARSIGLDETEIAQAVRQELAMGDAALQKPQVDVFEPGDPARVPGPRLAWVAALGALAILVFVFVFWRSFFSPAVPLPELTAPTASPGPAAPSAAPGTAPAGAESGGAVVFTALESGVWVKFYDAAGSQLLQKQLAQGESFTVPGNAVGPMLRTARPDALQITVAGRIVPKLADKAVSLRDVPVSAAALLGRGAPAPAAAPTTRPGSVEIGPEPSPRPGAASGPGPSPSPSPSPLSSPRPQAEARAPAPGPAAAPAAVPAPAAAPETSTVSN